MTEHSAADWIRTQADAMLFSPSGLLDTGLNEQLAHAMQLAEAHARFDYEGDRYPFESLDELFRECLSDLHLSCVQTFAEFEQVRVWLGIYLRERTRLTEQPSL